MISGTVPGGELADRSSHSNRPPGADPGYSAPRAPGSSRASRADRDGAFAGIDLGTQGVRVAIVDAQGTEIGSGRTPLRSSRREGVRHEQDPDEWWSAVGTAARQATASVDRDILSVAISSTSGTLLVCDDRLRPLSPGLMYDDARAGRELTDRAAAAGDRLWSTFGIRLQPSWALPKALWLRAAGVLEPRSHLLHQGDFVADRLAGEFLSTDSSQALKTGVDLVRIAWPTAVFDELGLDATLLPPVVLPGTSIGTVSREAAAHTGFSPGAVIKAGMTDGCAAQIASGALRPGSWSTALGTTLVVKGCSAAPLIDPTGAVYAHRSPDGGWLPGGASSVGAALIARDFAADELDELTMLAAAYEPAPGVMYPLAGPGERFPFVAPEAHYFADGIAETRAGRFASTLQAIAFTERLAYQRLAALGADIGPEIRISGGTARNPYFNQLRADVLGRTVVVPRSAESSTGAAILAAASPGTLAETAERMVSIAARYRPDEERGRRFDDAYRRFVAALADRGWLSWHAEPVAAR